MSKAIIMNSRINATKSRDVTHTENIVIKNRTINRQDLLPLKDVIYLLLRERAYRKTVIYRLASMNYEFRWQDSRLLTVERVLRHFAVPLNNKTLSFNYSWRSSSVRDFKNKLLWISS